MKVLLVSPKMKNPNGGIAIWTDIYLGACEEQGIDATLLNVAPVGRRAENGSAKRSIFDEISRTARIFKDMHGILKSDSFDVVHLNSSCGTFGIIRDYLIARKIKKAQPNIKLVSHFHCDIPKQIKSERAKKYLEKLLNISDDCFVLCENSRAYLEENFKKSSIKVPNFVDECVVASVPKSFNEKIERAFFVGRVSEAKGVKEIFELATRFSRIEFELVGAVSTEIAAIEAPQNVKLLGQLPHEKVLERLDGADVFVFPSHTEGFSIALAEAMARGVPSIATDVGAGRDMLEELGGFVVSVGDVDAMERAMLALDSQSTRQKMSAWCIEKVKGSYTKDAVMKMLYGVYERG